MTTIIKKDIAKSMSDKFDIDAEFAGELAQEFMNKLVGELLEGNRIELRGFGVFEIKQLKAHKGVNPGTGEHIIIPPHKAVKFKPSAVLKKKLKEQKIEE